MKKLFLIVAAATVSVACVSRAGQETQSSVAEFQQELNAEYRNPKTSPLRGSHLENFKQHPFFSENDAFRVTAKLVKTENSEVFDMPTSSGRSKKYREYGKLHFRLNGAEYTLTAFQSESLKNESEYRDYLFVPFRDLTNGEQTYGGGRYLDLKIPKSGQTLTLDFNKAYHPYCAYNATDYSCPIVPDENKLPVRITAGVMYEDIYFD